MAGVNRSSGRTHSHLVAAQYGIGTVPPSRTALRTSQVQIVVRNVEKAKLLIDKARPRGAQSTNLIDLARKFESQKPQWVAFARAIGDEYLSHLNTHTRAVEAREFGAVSPLPPAAFFKARIDQAHATLMAAITSSRLNGGGPHQPDPVASALRTEGSQQYDPIAALLYELPNPQPPGMRKRRNPGKA